MIIKMPAALFAAGIFLFFLICCEYSCVYTIFIECIALSVFLNSTVFLVEMIPVSGSK